LRAAGSDGRRVFRLRSRWAATPAADAGADRGDRARRDRHRRQVRRRRPAQGNPAGV